jgi:hypothetical protein
MLLSLIVAETMMACGISIMVRDYGSINNAASEIEAVGEKE